MCRFCSALFCLSILVLIGSACDGTNRNLETQINQAATDSAPVDYQDSEWSRWQGPKADGTTGYSLEHVSEICTRWELPAGLGYSSPVCVENKVILLDRVGDLERVRSILLTDGSVIWEQQQPVNFQTTFPMYTNGPIPTPVIAQDKVFTVGAEGRVQCLDLASGKVNWSVLPDDLMEARSGSAETTSHQLPAFGSGSSPVFRDGSLLVSLPTTGNRDSLFRLDVNDGSVVWHSVSARCSYASPVLTTMHGREIVLAMHDEGLSCVEWSSGRPLFEFPFRAKIVDSENAVDPIVNGNRIFLSAYGMPGTMLEVDNQFHCRQVWQNIKSIDSQYTNVILRNGILFGFSARTKRLHAADWQTGQSLGRWKLPMTRGMIVANPQRLLILGDNASLAIVDVSDLDDVTVQYDTELGMKPKVFCSPCLVGNQMLVRDEERLVAFELE